MAALVTTGPSALAQRRGTFAKGHASKAPAVRACRIASLSRTRVKSRWSVTAAGGTTIGAEEMAKDASAAVPLIGINPDRVPLVEAVNRGETSGEFNWEKQWYPVAVIDLLDPSKPHPTTLLGKDVVVWKDGDEEWNVFEDKCPHRLVPLSEGRVNEKGEIECGYHGWTFKGDTGACTNIPQLPAEGTAMDTALASPRSCVTPYHTQVAQGILWVYPVSKMACGDDIDALPALPLIPELEHPDCVCQVSLF